MIATLVVAATSVSPLFADISPIDGAPDASVISANCRFAQRLLSQIEHADAVIRVNRGSDYNDILDLFFAMNARVSSNKISAPKLTELSANFQNETNTFHDAYNKYDDALSALTTQDCTGSPNQFYSDLENVRKLVASINNSVANLDKIIADYRAELTKVVPQGGVE